MLEFGLTNWELQAARVYDVRNAEAEAELPKNQGQPEVYNEIQSQKSKTKTNQTDTLANKRSPKSSVSEVQNTKAQTFSYTQSFIVVTSPILYISSCASCMNL